eukprot:1349414-Rhodomonas_salina.6
MLLSSHALRSIVLRALYAMSGTDLAYGVTILRPSYAMSGTDMGHGLRPAYAMSGTEIGYAAARSGRRC